MTQAIRAGNATNSGLLEMANAAIKDHTDRLEPATQAVITMINLFSSSAMKTKRGTEPQTTGSVK